MARLGQTRHDFPFPVCSQFQPTVLDGELCYSMKADALKEGKSQPGKPNSLLLILDTGISKEEEYELTTENHPGMYIDSLNLDTEPTSKNPIKINIGTLASFSDHRVGSYSLQSLKKITGTESYMARSHQKCQLEAFETCHTKGS